MNTSKETNMSDQSDSISELAGALAKAQGAIVNAQRDVENTFFKSKYATLAATWDACRGPLSENGLAVVQAMTENEKGFVLVTTLAHASGQWMRSYYPVTPVKNDPQGLGSALTYARRYALGAIVGVAPSDDDDGEAVVGRGNNRFGALEQAQRPKAQVPQKDAKPAATLPPIPDKLEFLPTEILQVIAPLRPLIGTSFEKMTLDELDLVKSQAMAFENRGKTPEWKAWMTALQAESTHRIGNLEASK